MFFNFNDFSIQSCLSHLVFVPLCFCPCGFLYNLIFVPLYVSPTWCSSYSHIMFLWLSVCPTCFSHLVFVPLYVSLTWCSSNSQLMCSTQCCPTWCFSHKMFFLLIVCCTKCWSYSLFVPLVFVPLNVH